MRRLTRPRIEPQTLRSDGKGGKQAAENRKAWEEGREDEIRFPAHWGEADVRGALHAMQGFVCAYCQKRLDAHRGEVDHFRPKAGKKDTSHHGYFWLAYTFSNFFLSCAACNGASCKGDRFPLLDRSTRAKPTDASLKDELRELFDPAEDPIDKWMRVGWRPGEEEGFVLPTKAAAADTALRARSDVFVKFFRLNHDIDLKRARERAVRDAANARKSGDLGKLHRLACRYLPHGAAVYRFLQEIDKSCLPTPKEELLIWLSEAKERLGDACKSLKQLGPDPTNTRVQNELAWALAFLWKDPPPNTLTQEELASWIERELPEQKQDIEAKRQML